VPGLPLALLRMSVSIGVATVSYYALEQPIRRGIVAPRRLTAMGLSGSAVVVACLLAATRGAVHTEKIATLREAAGPTADAGTPDVLLIGDSVAERLGGPLQERGAHRGLRVMQMGQLGCTLLVNTRVRFPNGRTLPLDSCDPARANWFEAVAQRKPTLVLVVEGGTGLGQRWIGDHWRQPCEPGYDEALDRDLSAAVHAFAAHGVRTVLTTSPVPELSDVNPHLLGLPGGASPDALREPMAEHLECQNRVRRIVAERTGASLIDLAEFVCPSGVCRREIHGVPLRTDGVHFEGEAADIVSDWLLDRIGEMKLLGRADE